MGKEINIFFLKFNKFELMKLQILNINIIQSNHSRVEVFTDIDSFFFQRYHILIKVQWNQYNFFALSINGITIILSMESL